MINKKKNNTINKKISKILRKKKLFYIISIKNYINNSTL